MMLQARRKWRPVPHKILNIGTQHWHIKLILCENERLHGVLRVWRLWPSGTSFAPP